MAEYGIRVRVNGQSICMKSDSLQHKFTLGDLMKYCDIYQIPYSSGTFMRGGKPLTDDDDIVNNDFITISMPKASAGLKD